MTWEEAGRSCLAYSRRVFSTEQALPRLNDIVEALEFVDALPGDLGCHEECQYLYDALLDATDVTAIDEHGIKDLSSVLARTTLSESSSVAVTVVITRFIVAQAHLGGLISLLPSSSPVGGQLLLRVLTINRRRLEACRAEVGNALHMCSWDASHRSKYTRCWLKQQGKARPF